jgi:hypothetical protein
MLRPTGSLPSSVYWRRRLLLIGLVLLAGLTGYVVFASGEHGNKPVGSRSTGPPPAAPASSSTVEIVPCVPSVLSVAARTEARTYKIGQQPELEIQVTNVGDSPCIANLSDSQIELLVYNGESRVWGSHDCQIQPGASPLALVPGRSVRRSVRWTGLSSQPHCAGDRQRVGMGNYTLHARYGQIDGRTTMFSIA